MDEAATVCTPKSDYGAFWMKDPRRDRGQDISDSLQGAGGIGGLLSCTRGPPDSATYVFLYDANGNVSELLDSSSPSTPAAHYEYSPFGETIVSTGSAAKGNPFRFSTKYWDDETGLGYWGYRYYQPDEGRWLSRDPIGDMLLLEASGLVDVEPTFAVNDMKNLSRFAGNNVINSLDVLGLSNVMLGGWPEGQPCCAEPATLSGDLAYKSPATVSRVRAGLPGGTIIETRRSSFAVQYVYSGATHVRFWWWNCTKDGRGLGRGWTDINTYDSWSYQYGGSRATSRTWASAFKVKAEYLSCENSVWTKKGPIEKHAGVYNDWQNDKVVLEFRGTPAQTITY